MQPLFAYVVWPHAVSAYGPLWESMSRLVAYFAGELLGSADPNALLRFLFGYKLLSIIGYVLCGVAIWAALGGAAARWRWLGLLFVAVEPTDAVGDNRRGTQRCLDGAANGAGAAALKTTHGRWARARLACLVLHVALLGLAWTACFAWRAPEYMLGLILWFLVQLRQSSLSVA